MRKTELIKIREFQRRVWGENGTPLTGQTIRDQLKRDVLPGAQIGRLWFVDWTAYQRMTGNALGGPKVVIGVQLQLNVQRVLHPLPNRSLIDVHSAAHNHQPPRL